jgi:hypothetical protein
MPMSDLPPDRLVYALSRTAELPSWPLPDWELLVRQARQADLLARIAEQLDALGLTSDVPSQPRAHLEGARRLSRAQRDEVGREIGHLEEALTPLGLPVLLLKGAAYVVAQLPAAAGRLFSDIDILVPKARLSEVEGALISNGWMISHTYTTYDQRYYRQWMHELPPMVHMRRGTVVDVHHTILPETARLRPNAETLMASASRVAKHNGVSILAPHDMILHSMTHLFHNEEMSHGLRDLSDLDLLLRHFNQLPQFWDRLIERSHELDLVRPLYYGLRFANLILNTPRPAQTLRQVSLSAPNWPMRTLTDALWRRALCSQHSTAALPLTREGLALLFVRAHWLRMPPLLLLRHLATKLSWCPLPRGACSQ